VSALAQVTPVVLTWNEEANLGRVLADLRWAPRVVVVDSGSTDATPEIARGFGNVRWLVRPFDTHAAQWRYGVECTDTEYVLALDADYRVPPPFTAEIERAFLPGRFAGGVAAFRYHVRGRPLKGSVYPPKVVIFRRDDVEIGQPGHSQDVSVRGPQYRFAERLVHDDRKPVGRFVRSQIAYAKLEADRLEAPGAARWQDRLRRAAVMPFLAGPGAFLAAGGPAAGWRAVQYACERTVFECLLVMELLRRRHRGNEGDDSAG
jgi:glycosyltransferase involved in cell wall biosynthesis